MQRGSDDIEIGSDAGGVPMNVTLPPTVPAVAGSTGLATGAAGVGAGFSPPPPHAVPITATVRVRTESVEPSLMRAPLLMDNKRTIIPFRADTRTRGRPRP